MAGRSGEGSARAPVSTITRLATVRHVLGRVRPAARLAARPLAGAGRRRGPRSRLRLSLRASTAEGVFAELFGACAGATALTGWALHLGAGPVEVALVGALPQLAQLVQVPAAFATTALGGRRVALLSVAVSRQVFLPLAALPFLPVGPATARAVLLAVAATSAVLGVLGNNAWTAWMGELVPGPLRGRYFGRRTALCTLGGTLGGVLAARVLDAAASRHLQGVALGVLALVACGLGAVTTALMARQHEPAGVPAARPSLAAALRPARDPDARSFLGYQLAWNVAVGLGGGFFTFHLLHNLRASFTVVAMQAASCAALKMVTAPAWGRAVDRFGARPVLAACSFAIASLPIVWLTTAPDRIWPIAFDALIGGIAWGGHAIASFALPLAVAPRRERPFYLAAFSMAGGVAFALSAAAGGVAAAALPRAVATLGRHGGHGLEILFVASALGRLLGGFLALRIAERGAGSLLELHRAAQGAAIGVLVEARERVRRIA